MGGGAVGGWGEGEVGLNCDLWDFGDGHDCLKQDLRDDGDGRDWSAFLTPVV